MIDGCFLKCHGRVLSQLIGEEKMVQIDTLPLHKKYSDIFSMDDVPEAERQAVARQVADKIIAMLRKEGSTAQERTRPATEPTKGASCGGAQSAPASSTGGACSG